MKKKSDLSKLFEYAGSFKYLTILSWILSALSALVALFPYVYIWRVMKEILEVAPDFSRAVGLAHNGWMAVLFAVLSMVIYIGALMCSHIAAFRVQFNIRSHAMHHITKLPLGFLDGIGSGKMRKIINESSAATETFLAHQLPDTVGALATPIGLLFLLFYFDWKLGLLSLIPIVIAFGIMILMAGPGMKDRMKEYQNALDQMSNEAVEYVRGIPVVKTFGQSVFSFKRFKASIENYEKWVIAYTKQLRLPMLFYTTAINGIFAVLIAAALVITAHGVTNTLLLNLLFYIIITPVITVTLNKIMYASENKMVVADALSRIESVMILQPMAVPENGKEPKDNSISLRDVSFRYKGGKRNALEEICFDINRGDHVAFVGPSGGGKTTLASLIARFWDVDAGEILIGGVNVKNIEKKDLMNTVSFVFQDSKLLKASIFENVRMAKPDATKDEVLQALHAAQCDDIVEKLPQGINTVIGTNGVYLSGGEQQRIAIARVMLKNAPILILDEATAFADPDNEAKVQKAFARLSKGKTVIMIAHRLSTVTSAHRIFVLKDGKIVESGNHEDLVEKSGFYGKMWQEYNRAAQWKVGGSND